MKKHLIAALVGALIIFIWQFLSWSLLNVHGAETAYTPNQEKILEFLSQNMEDGEYFLPNAAPGASSQEEQTVMENAIGKPWAQISYHSKMEMSMPLNLIRGFLIDFVAAWLLVWMLLKFANLDFKTTLLATLAVGFIGYLAYPYLNSIWFERSTLGYLVDLVVQWGLLGSWLGWYLNK